MAIIAATANRILSSLVGLNENQNKGTCFIALSTTDPGISGANFTEPTAAEYERVLIGDPASPSSQLMEISTDKKVWNKDIIYFPECTSDEGWGTITHFGIFTAKTGGELLLYGAVSPSVTVEKDRVPLFRKHDFSLVLS